MADQDLANLEDTQRVEHGRRQGVERSHKRKMVRRMFEGLGEAIDSAQTPDQLGLVPDRSVSRDMATPTGILEARERPNFARALQQGMSAGAERQASLDAQAAQSADGEDYVLPFFRPDVTDQGVDIVLYDGSGNELGDEYESGDYQDDELSWD